jgi:hypothetical protein
MGQFYYSAKLNQFQMGQFYYSAKLNQLQMGQFYYSAKLNQLQMGQFYYSAKAFDVLERLDPNPEYWEGKRGACIGLFQQIIAGHEPR